MQRRSINREMTHTARLLFARIRVRYVRNTDAPCCDTRLRPVDDESARNETFYLTLKDSKYKVILYYISMTISCF